MPAIVNSFWETGGGGIFDEEREHESGLGVDITMEIPSNERLKGAANRHREAGVAGQIDFGYLTLVRQFTSAPRRTALKFHLSRIMLHRRYT